jgi:hypothetical protein
MCLWELTTWRSWSFICKGGWYGLFLLLEITIVYDIVNEINAEIKLFADDTSLYLIVDNPNDTAFLLNQDLNQIQRWTEKWPLE